MSAPIVTSNRRSLPSPRFQREAAGRMPSAQHILWREWRNCDDADYARYLFGLLVDQPLDELAIAVFGLIGAILGAIGGLLIALLASAGSTGTLPWSAGALSGLFVGLMAAAVAGLALWLGGRSRWGAWLQGFAPSPLVSKSKNTGGFDRAGFVLCLGLAYGVAIGTVIALLSGQSDLQFLDLFLIPVMFIFPIFYSFKGEPANPVEWIGGIIVGGALGVLLGVSSVQGVGGLVNLPGVLNLALVIGLGVGFGLGWFWGRGAGFIGLFITQVALTGLILAIRPGNVVLLGWLLGLLAGGVLGSYSLMWRPADRSLSFESAYTYRRAFLWWAVRPLAAQVEAALAAQAGQERLLQRLREPVVSTAMVRSAASGKAVLPGQMRRRERWSSVWRHLYLRSLIGGAPASPEETQTDGVPRKPAKAAEDLVKDLQATTWQERFLARHALVALGGEVVPKLLDFARGGKSYDLGAWLIGSIVDETGRRLAGECRLWICPACLTICGAHTVKDKYGLPIAYYGCRTCGQSRHLLHCPQGIVAVLDAEWLEAYSYQDNQLRANWLVCRTLFDFDTVEIVRAADQDVERLAMNAGNDTDPVRKARYPHVRCVVAPDCRLSENSLRVLEQVFGQVESRETLQG
jgi:hypothetical protein